MPRAKRGQEKQALRPQKMIDWKIVDEFLIAGCKGTEIAGYFSIHPETFYARVEQEKGMGFTEYSQQKQSHGKSLLRHKQFEKAMKGSDKMLVHCGKHMLDQHDRIHQDINSTSLVTQRSILELPDNGRREIVQDEKSDDSED